MKTSKKIVVTGGAGMIGSNLVARLLKEGHEVIVIDNLWRGSIDNLKYTCKERFKDVKLVIADLSVPGDWYMHFQGVDCVYHLADIVAGIGYVFSNEGYLFRKNLLINSIVTQVVASFDIPRYVYVGTACSYPKELQTGVDARPLKESDQFPASPESAYGWSKLMGELDATYLAHEKNMETVVLSFHNVYGTPCDYKSNKSQVIPSVAYRAVTATDPKQLVVWGNGIQGRAFIHVSDVVDGLVSALTKGHNVGSIQLGPDVCTSIRQISETIRDIVDPSIEIVFDTTKPTGDQGRCADFTKANKELGWSPKVDLHEGLMSLVEYVKTCEKINN
jgi:GDP-D-mannose 3',5'-epimerase